jgi:release factor glutamine methyltransferase
MTAASSRLTVRSRATVKEVLQQHILLTSSDSPLLDCQILLGCVLKQSRTWLYAHDDYELSSVEANRFHSIFASRASGVPIAYITGAQEFWSMEFQVTRDTLIPRPDTELIIEILLDRFSQARATVIDLGTGAGPIAIALSRERPAFEIFATDISLATLQIAQLNNVQLTDNQVNFVVSDWLEAFSPNQFDIIVSNPPYIDAGDPHLESLRHEPQSALVSQKNGLQDLEKIIRSSQRYLKPGGMILLEHGYNQRTEVCDLLKSSHYTQMETLDDLAGQPRVVLAYKAAS